MRIINNILVIFSSLVLIACASHRKYPLETPNGMNSILVKANKVEAQKLALNSIVNELNISEIDTVNHDYILAESKTSSWNLLLGLYGNYGTLVSIFFKETTTNETIIWLETAKKASFTLGSYFEKDWKPSVLNAISKAVIDSRADKISLARVQNKTHMYPDTQSSIHTSFKLKTNECTRKFSWTTISDREQGGGWLFFTGKGIADDLRSAYLSAESMAVHRLALECNGPHMNTRMIERCDDIDETGKVIAYVRANVLESDCNELKRAPANSRNKYINPELKKLVDAHTK